MNIQEFIHLMVTLVAIKAILVGSRFRFDLWVKYGKVYSKFNYLNDEEFTDRENAFIAEQEEVR